MRIRSLETVALVLLLASAVGVSGCRAPARDAEGSATYGFIRYENDEAIRYYRRDFERTWQATLSALRKLGHVIPSDPAHGRDGGTIESDDVRVRVEPQGDLTRVRVRTGNLARERDRRRADLLLETITEEVQ